MLFSYTVERHRGGRHRTGPKRRARRTRGTATGRRASPDDPQCPQHQDAEPPQTTPNAHSTQHTASPRGTRRWHPNSTVPLSFPWQELGLLSSCVRAFRPTTSESPPTSSSARKERVPRRVLVETPIYMPVTTRHNPSGPDERAREDDLPPVENRGENPQPEPSLEVTPVASSRRAAG